MRISLRTIHNCHHRVSPWVFWPPFTLILVAMMLSLAYPVEFAKQLSAINNVILDYFDLAFSWTAFTMVLLCVFVLLSPMGKIRIGGANAQPIFGRFRWFSVVLCTSVAVGILFWGTAEPLYHIIDPPKSLANASMTHLEHFAMSTMFMHWSFTPYAIYAVPAVLFALAYYNHQKPFSLSSMLFPLISTQGNTIKTLIDMLCLFALVAGMAASLAAGLLSISGGLARLTSLSVDGATLTIVAVLIVGVFTASAASGLLKGIKHLSTINVLIFILLSGFILLAGSAYEVARLAFEGMLSYILNFVPHSLSVGDFSDEAWTHGWTTFYWANWMAWAPVTALFMGRISYGYTVREFMLFTWLLPACFSIVWMSIFSGTVIHLNRIDGTLSNVLLAEGPEAVIYYMIEAYPGTLALSILFIFTMFISYVTAADSNTMAMSGLSSKGISPSQPEPPLAVKLIWGMLIGLVALVMVSFSGVEGIKMLSNLGGFPALILLIFCCLALIRLLLNKTKQNKKATGL